MNKRVQTAKFVIADLLSAAIAWSIFFFLRKSAELQSMQDTLQIVLNDNKFYSGIITIAWIIGQQLLTEYFILQPIIAAMGLAIIIFSLMPSVQDWYWNKD